jgi:hypothetical protein
MTPICRRNSKPLNAQTSFHVQMELAIETIFEILFYIFFYIWYDFLTTIQSLKLNTIFYIHAYCIMASEFKILKNYLCGDECTAFSIVTVIFC